MSASRMERIMSCPASFKLENQMPPVPSGEAADRGTRIHEISEKLLNGLAVDGYEQDMLDGYEQEELEVAQQYVKYVDALRSNAVRFGIEVKINKGLQELHPLFGGTADAVVIKDNTLHVVDLKTGRVPVQAEENRQLLTYALGVARQFKAPTDVTIKIHIWQPGNVSVWQTTPERLRQHGKDMVNAANEATSSNPKLAPSSETCKYCKAKPICPAMREKVQESARQDFVSASEPVITPEMLDQAEQAIAWGESVQIAAKALLKSGTAISGWGLKPGRKMRSWADEAVAAQVLAAQPQAWTLKSVAAVTKLGIDVAALIEEKTSEPSLARK
jgi:RecB family exonuclease